MRWITMVLHWHQPLCQKKVCQIITANMYVNEQKCAKELPEHCEKFNSAFN